MPGTSKTIEVKSGIDRFFEIITEFESYPDFLKELGLIGVVVESSKGNEVVVTQKVKKLGKIISYTLKYTLDRPRALSWKLERGDMMSRNEGSWKLEEIDQQHIRAIYSVDVRFGLLVPKSIVNVMISSELPSMLEAFKKKAESEKL